MPGDEKLSILLKDVETYLKDIPKPLHDQASYLTPSQSFKLPDAVLLPQQL